MFHTGIGTQAQQRLEGQAEAVLDIPINSLEQAAPVPRMGSPKPSPHALGRTATPARSNLLQLVTDNLDEVCLAWGCSILVLMSCATMLRVDVQLLS